MHTYLVVYYNIRRYSLANLFLLACYFESEPIDRILFFSLTRVVPHELRTYTLRRASILLRIALARACVRARTYINLAQNMRAMRAFISANNNCARAMRASHQY